MNKRLLRLMHNLLGSQMRSFPGSAWHPPVDVYRYEYGWLLKFELAGIRTEDIEVSIKGHHLTVQGTRRDWSTQEGHKSYLMEISYNRFERSIEMPCNLEEARVIMEYRDGMLLVFLQTEVKESC